MEVHWHKPIKCSHYNDVIMGAIASQITSLTIVYSTVYSDADQRNHQSSASLAFVRGIHRGPVNSPHKWPVTLKCFHLMMSSCFVVRITNWIKIIINVNFNLFVHAVDECNTNVKKSYITTQSGISIWAKPEVIRRKHIVGTNISLEDRIMTFVIISLLTCKWETTQMFKCTLFLIGNSY